MTKSILPAALCLCLCSPLLADSDPAVGTAPPVWWANGSAHARLETAGGQISGSFSALVPLHGTLGDDGSLSGTLWFAEPFAEWVEGGASQAGIGLGVRHLFGSQPTATLGRLPEKTPGILDEGIYIGANTFFNFADTTADQRFTQAVFGVEAGTRWLELRGRYHLPLDDGHETEEHIVTRFDRPINVGGIRGVQSLIFDSTLTLLTESLRGWQADATLLVPWIDRWADLRIIGGYAKFESPTEDSLEYDSWRLGVDFRPVPAVVLSAMWYENERLVGDHWLFGLGVEIPFSISDRGSSGGFWKNVKNAFKPRRRHLAERLIEPSRRNTLPMQIGTSRQKVETQITYTATIILPDGRVVEVSETSSTGSGGGLPPTFGLGVGLNASILAVSFPIRFPISIDLSSTEFVVIGSADALTPVYTQTGTLVLVGPTGERVYASNSILGSLTSFSWYNDYLSQGYTPPTTP